MDPQAATNKRTWFSTNQNLGHFGSLMLCLQLNWLKNSLIFTIFT